MRLLLAATRSEKGAIAANADAHLEHLRAASAAACDLATFPEMSLTGSVDPVRHPERAVALDDPAVLAVARATGDLGVAALFGIGERRDGEHFITQVHAADGLIVGVQRKRVLGEDEEGFSTSTTTTSFAQGREPFGVLICAESQHDATWTATAATGAGVIVVCAAPGLYGRRTDEAGWQEGYDWWQGEVIADARRNATRLGVWVAVTTQVGSTVDEDFPGGAALIEPSGEVVAQLPDWRPGTLTVETPGPAGRPTPTTTTA